MADGHVQKWCLYQMQDRVPERGQRDVHIRFYFEDSGCNRCNSQGNRLSLLHRGF